MVTSLTSSFAEFKFAGDILSYKKYDDRIEFKLSNALFNLYVIDKNIIRFKFTDHNEFSNASSYAVIYRSAVPYSFLEKEIYYQVSTPELIIRISKSPCRVSVYDKDMNLINEDEKSFGVSFDNAEIRCFKTLFKDELFYGLGEKTKSLKKMVSNGQCGILIFRLTMIKQIRFINPFRFLSE